MIEELDSTTSSEEIGTEELLVITNVLEALSDNAGEATNVSASDKLLLI